MPAIPAIISAVPALVTGGASIASGLIKKSAAGKAENIQSEAGLQAANLVGDATKGAKEDLTSNVTAANGTLADVYNNLNGKLDPYLAAGGQGLQMLLQAFQPGGDLSGKFAFNPKDLANEPGYKFQLKEGEKALANSAAAGGSLGSGGAAKSLLGFSQGLADSTFDKAYGRALSTYQTNRNNTLGSLGMLTNVGTTALNQSINVGENYGNQTAGNYRFLGSELAQTGQRGALAVGDILTGRANAQAAGTVAEAGNLANGINGAANAFNSWYSGRTPKAQGPSTQTLWNLPTRPAPGALNPWAGVNV